VSNALIESAELGAFAEVCSIGLGIDNAIGIPLKLIKKLSGGLWVGGRVFLTTHRVIFMPNGLNTALTDGIDTVALRLADIISCKNPGGFGPTNAVVSTNVGDLKLRAHRSANFIEQLQRAKCNSPK
jgi:hypothetical protein